LFTTRVTICGTEISAPYDFRFQLRHYVIAPEVREDEKLVEIVRLSSGELVKVDVMSRGTIEAPHLELTIFAVEPLTLPQVNEVRERVAWHLSLDDDLRPFYTLAADDPVLSASIEHNVGGKGKHAYSLFDGVIDVILFQNTAFRRAYAMRANLGAAFGDRFVAGGRVYHASPTPEQLAAAPLETIRATTKVGYRDRYVKGVAEAVVGGTDLEAVKQLPRDEARRELLRLPGVGPYTADLALIRGAGRREGLFLDVYIREVLRQLYFCGARIPDDQLRTFAQAKWGSCQGYAAFYLATDTESWAKKLGISLRVRSAALSSPDSSVANTATSG
jgi:3-methyladenine DNA glycosylase/8-oxoguanine DNA glycosylase